MNNKVYNLISGLNIGIKTKTKRIRSGSNKQVLSICKILYEEGLISHYSKENNFVLIGLRFYGGKSLLKELSSVSLRERYLTRYDLLKKSDFLIMETSKGIMSSFKARLLGLGGTILLKVVF